MTSVDQILVQRLGGWVLISKDEWLAIGADEQASLLSQDAVQFVSAGDLLAPEVAMPLLNPPPKPKPVVEDAGPPVEIAPVRKIAAVYRRAVIAGPAFQVQRTGSDEVMVPLHELRERPADYELETDDGVADLAADLFADAFGIQERIALSVAAVRAFRADLFDVRLGNRVWTVEASDIRDHIESNPHVILAS